GQSETASRSALALRVSASAASARQTASSDDVARATMVVAPTERIVSATITSSNTMPRRRDALTGRIAHSSERIDAQQRIGCDSPVRTGRHLALGIAQA